MSWSAAREGRRWRWRPRFFWAQLWDVVDLDAPVFLQADRAEPAGYENRLIEAAPALWGYLDQSAASKP